MLGEEMRSLPWLSPGGSAQQGQARKDHSTYKFPHKIRVVHTARRCYRLGSAVTRSEILVPLHNCSLAYRQSSIYCDV